MKMIKMTKNQFETLQQFNWDLCVSDTEFRCCRCQAPFDRDQVIWRRYHRNDCGVCVDCAKFLPKAFKDRKTKSVKKR
jgi:hypothetical protein